MFVDKSAAADNVVDEELEDAKADANPEAVWRNPKEEEGEEASRAPAETEVTPERPEETPERPEAG